MPESSIADNLRDALRFRLIESRLSQRHLAAQVGISEKHLSRILNGHDNASIALWDQLFDATAGGVS